MAGRGKHRKVSAAEALERDGGVKPLCGCHGEPMRWAASDEYVAGGRYRCAVKSREKDARYYENNREKIREREARYYENNREKIREREARYYENNGEKIREREARYRENNREKIREKKARYYEENRESILQLLRDRYDKDPIYRIEKSLKKRRRLALASIARNRKKLNQLLREEIQDGKISLQG